MHLGFSYVGALMLAMLLLPNFLWIKNKPVDYDRYAARKNKLLLCMERAGEVSVSVLCVSFSDFNLGAPHPWTLWLAGAMALMVLYEGYWIRYFHSEKTIRDFYRSFLGVPVAGAVLPVLAFLLLAVYGKNIFLGIAVVILGVGHIGIHLAHQREALQ